MIRLFFIMLALLVVSCGTENSYLKGNTQVTVEYYGEPEVSTCYPELRCDIKDNTKCVMMLYEEIKRTTKKGLELVREGDYPNAAFQFSSALCTAISIDGIFERMKSDNRREWKVFKKAGAIERIRMVGMKLSLLVAECEDMYRAEE